VSSVSQRRDGPVAAVVIGLALVLCGCSTTQQTAARLQLNDARLRATATRVRLTATASGAPVRVSGLSLLAQGRHRATAVVSLENPSARAVSDLPISVGYRLGGRTVYLNGATGLSYFDNHIPSVAPHGSLRWVDTTAGTIPRGARPFAYLGARPTAPVGTFTLPDISVGTSQEQSAAGGGEALTLRLTNRTSIPQYQLPVYAVSTVSGRVVAAADRSLTELAGGAHVTLRIVLDGSLGSAAGAAGSVRVQAPPTIFR
jgi:hypothetical protein